MTEPRITVTTNPPVPAKPDVVLTMDYETACVLTDLLGRSVGDTSRGIVFRVFNELSETLGYPSSPWRGASKGVTELIEGFDS